MDDKNIILLLQQGDEPTFKHLVEKYQSKVHNTVISYLQNTEEAEEITQDVFIEVYRSIGKFDGRSSLSTWIYRVAVNKSLDHIRHKKRKKRFAFLTSLFGAESGELIHDKPTFDHPGVLLEQKESAKYLFAAIDELPETQKTAFILSQVEDMPQKEIAEVMGISVKAVESLIQRGKANLRKKLENMYPNRRE